MIPLLVLLALGPSAPSSRAHQIIAWSLAARGGAARFAAIRSLDQRTELDFTNGQHWPIWVRQKAPNKIRLEITTPQGKVVQAFDGHVAWQMDPGASAAHRLTGAEARQVENEGFGFVDMAVDPASHGTRIAYAGKGLIEGRSYVAVRYTLATGDRFVQYFDRHTGLVFHEEFPLPRGHGEEDIRDYRRVAGLLFPTRYPNLPRGPTLVILRTQLNVRLDDIIFAPPPDTR